MSRKLKYYYLTFVKHDFKAGLTVFFVALPLCLGIALSSGVSAYSGIVSGIIGGVIVTLISRSELSVSGPAAGLTAICAAAITDLGSAELFFLAVAVAGLLQIVLGVCRLGGFTHFIPSSVIKGMLAAIGIILISKQVPLLIGYDQPYFWNDKLYSILTFNHAFEEIDDLYHHTTASAIIISVLSLLTLIAWKKWLAGKLPFLPASFVTVAAGVGFAMIIARYFPGWQLKPGQYVSLPENIAAEIRFPDAGNIYNVDLWRYAVVICFVASLETLLSIAAIDKLDSQNRITPQNRELVAQGTGNFISGMVGGIPLTAVIVRSSANAEAGARTRLSAFTHGLWLLVAVLFAVPLINSIPYCVLAVILIRTGYNLAKPSMILSVVRQGKEQALPFLVTIVAILFTDLLIGVLIGIAYAVYFLVKHTYLAGYTLKEENSGHAKMFIITLALNVTFLNKKRFIEMLDRIPEYSIVEINGEKSIYIDRDVLEVFQEFRSKAHRKHIQLNMISIPEVEIIEVH